MTSRKYIGAAAALLLPALASAHPGHHGAAGHAHGPEFGFAVGVAVIVVGALGMYAFRRRRPTTAARRRSRT
jgi:hypothetical protein